MLFDKWKTKIAAKKCHIPVAEGEIIDLLAVSYADIAQSYGSKFVIKPLQSFEHSNLSQRQKVEIVSSESEYQDYADKNGRKGQPYLIESFFSGKGEGISIFAVEGEVHAAFAHIRVAEPNSGGGSSYRKSVRLDKELLEATRALCKHVNYTGVAMFEFRRNPETLQWILVEVNARFWGSLPLAILADVDFPSLYANYLVGGVIPAKPVLDYRSELYARSFMADVYEIRREYEIGHKEYGKSKAVLRCVSRLVQMVKVVTPWEAIDSFSIYDPKPFWGELGELFASLMSSLFKNNFIRLWTRRYYTKCKLKKLFRITTNRRIIFVCYGNIMRSPFALFCLKKLVEGIPAMSIDCDSFGFHMVEERRCPKNSLESAAAFDCDLNSHRSKWLTQLDLRDSDIIIYFDEKNRMRLDAYYAFNNSFCAADLVDSSLGYCAEIEDPYGRDSKAVTACYQQIQSSVINLLNLYKGVEQ